MPHHKSAIKRVRQTKTRRAYNRFYQVKVRRAVKHVLAATTHEEAVELMRAATKVLDKTSARGIFHKNFASNKKSQLAKHVNSLKG